MDLTSIGSEPAELKSGATPDLSSVSVVVPVFNGAKTISQLVGRCAATLGELRLDHEIILVNDGSHDDSWDRIKALCTEWPQVRGIDLLRNSGQHSALLAGIRSARGEVIVTLDDDLQNPPEEMPKLLAVLAGDCDVVYGTPIEKRHGAFRNLASRMVSGVLFRMGDKSVPVTSAYRAFRSDLRLAFADYRGPEVSLDGILTWGTDRFGSVPVEHLDRARGESNYDIWKLLRHGLTTITAFSTKPLRLATMIGFAATLFGLAVLAYVLIRYLAEGTTVPGFAFIASLIAVLGGAQLFTIGVIGEYLAHVHVRVMERPSYTIREEVGGTAETPEG